MSACLLGFECRFDGSHSLSEELVNEASAFFLPICPELLGGLLTPRPPAQITQGVGADVLDGVARVVDADSNDLTASFMAGAEEALRLARLTGASRAILKEKSPSCGVSTIKKDDRLIPGMGVTAALLARNGFDVEGR